MRDFRGRPVGDLMLRGRTEPLRAFKPLRIEQFGNPATQSYLEMFAKLEAGNPGAMAALAAHVGIRSLQARSLPLLPKHACPCYPHADAGPLDRNVQSSKMLYAALLLLMLEAVTTDLVSPLARSAAPKIFSYPQGGRPITAFIGGKPGNICSQ